MSKTRGLKFVVNRKLILQRLNDKKWSQRRASIESGLAESQFSQIAIGAIENVKVSTLGRICKVLDIQFNDAIIEKN